MPQDMPDDLYPAESEIECPRCGEVFYYELNRCPNCGLSVYEPEEADRDGEDAEWDAGERRDTLEEWLSALTPAAAIFAGLFLSFVVSTGIFIVVRNFFGELVMTGLGRTLPLLSVPLGAAVGGYAAAAMEGENPRRMGWWVGGLSIIAAVVLAGIDRDLDAGGWIAPETIPVWIVTVLCGAAGGEFYRRQQRDVVVHELFADLPSEASLYKDLMAMTGHDAALVERLIDYELYYMPNANRRTLLESAIRRLERDRG
jgi:hypothetical protein